MVQAIAAPPAVAPAHLVAECGSLLRTPGFWLASSPASSFAVLPGTPAYGTYADVLPLVGRDGTNDGR